MDISPLRPVLDTRWGATSDIGPVRAINEDSWMAAPPVFLIADGMGGHSGGDHASSLAVRVLEARLSPDGLDGRRLALDDVRAALDAASVAINSIAADHSRAPGTTLTGILAFDDESGPQWLAVNIGDSRAYLVAGGQIRQITHDHSEIQEAKDLAEALGVPVVLPPSNVVTRALGAGMFGAPKADYFGFPVCEGDVIVLTSDGIHGVVDDDEILRIVLADDNPQNVATALVDRAIECGTRDNATALVVRAWGAFECEDSRAELREIVSANPVPARSDSIAALIGEM